MAKVTSSKSKSTALKSGDSVSKNWSSKAGGNPFAIGPAKSGAVKNRKRGSAKKKAAGKTKLTSNYNGK